MNMPVQKTMIVLLCGWLPLAVSAAIYTRVPVSGNWSALSEWKDDSTGSFQDSAALPGSDDTVVVNNDRTLNLDTNAVVGGVQIANNSLRGTFHIDDGNTLTVLGSIKVGQDPAGEAAVNQSAGSVTADTLQIGALSGGAGSGTYLLSGGTLEALSALSVNSNGLLEISGGTLRCAYSNEARLVAGGGSVRLLNGAFEVSGSGSPDRLRWDVGLLEVSGGTLSIDSQLQLGYQADAELRIVGDDAVITLGSFNQQASQSPYGTVRFVFDETGISSVEAPGFMHLEAVEVIVDGSAYTGPAGIFELFSTPNLASFAAESAITVSGFEAYGDTFVTQMETGGLVLEVAPVPPVQDVSSIEPAAGGSRMKLVIPPTIPGTGMNLLGCSNLTDGIWSAIPLSDDGVNPFEFSAPTGSVVYVDSAADRYFYRLMQGTGTPRAASWYEQSLLHIHCRLTPFWCGEDIFFKSGDRMAGLGVKTFLRHIKTGPEDPWWMFDSFPSDPPAFTGLSATQSVEIVQRMFSEPVEQGLNVIGYYWLGSDDNLLAAHPDWACLNLDGSPQAHDTKGNYIDITTPAYQQIVIDRLKILASTGVTAAYFDNRHGNAAGCFGSTCEQLYLDQGGTLPTAMSWDDPEYLTYLDFNAKKLAEAVGNIRRGVQEEFPEFRTITSCTVLPSLAYPLMHTSLAREAETVKIEFRLAVLRSILPPDVYAEMKTSGPYTPITTRLAYGMNLLRTVSRTQPHVWGHDFMTLPQVQAFIMGTLAQGCAVNLDLFDLFVLQREADAYGLDENEVKWLVALGNRLSMPLRGTTPVRYAAVLHSESMRLSYSTNHLAAWQQAVMPPQLVYRELMQQAVPVDVISDVNLEEGDTDGYEVLFVPDRDRLSAPVQQALTLFETGGGTVIDITNAAPRSLSAGTSAAVASVVSNAPARLEDPSPDTFATLFADPDGERQLFFISNDLSWIQHNNDASILEFSDIDVVNVENSPENINGPPSPVSGLELVVQSEFQPEWVYEHVSQAWLSAEAVEGGFRVSIPAFQYGAAVEIRQAQ